MSTIKVNLNKKQKTDMAKQLNRMRLEALSEAVKETDREKSYELLVKARILMQIKISLIS